MAADARDNATSKTTGQWGAGLLVGGLVAQVKGYVWIQRHQLAAAGGDGGRR